MRSKPIGDDDDAPNYIEIIILDSFSSAPLKNILIILDLLPGEELYSNESQNGEAKKQTARSAYETKYCIFT